MGTSDTTAGRDAAEGTLVSIGYEGRTVGDLVAQLLEQDVQVLVDVHLTPLSRKPGLSKAKLAEAHHVHPHHPSPTQVLGEHILFARGKPVSSTVPTHVEPRTPPVRRVHGL